MAGVSTTNRSNIADADGSTTVFNFTFFVYSADDIKVYSVLDDVLTPITTGITKAINSNFVGGTVTFAVAPADAVGDILIRREVPYTQGTEFADITRYKETAIEAALNALCLEVQQVAEESSLSPKYTEAAGVTDATIEEPVDGAVLVFNGVAGRIKAALIASLETSLDTLLTGLAANDFLKYNGTNWINRTPSQVLDDLGFTTFTKTLIDDADASAFLTTLGFSAFIQTLLNDADAATARATIGAVGLTGDESVGGVKTFSGSSTVVQGLLNLSASGAGQVQFPATQNASAGANVFDDYEEGTCTFALTFDTPGNLSIAYAAQVGSYTKIGNFCRATCNIQTSTFTHTTASGQLQLTGYPFAAANVTSNQHYGCLDFSGITKATYTQFTVFLNANATTGGVIAGGTAVARDPVAASNMPTGGTVHIRFTMCYQTAS